ncbi:unnamed protein product [Discosporangium mesarthrocarpum]
MTGIGSSRQLRSKELRVCTTVSTRVNWSKLYGQTHFKYCELRGLYNLFQSLTKNPKVAPFSAAVPVGKGGEGLMRRDQFLGACASGGSLGLSEVVGHFGSRLFDMIDTDGDGLLCFKEFVVGLSHLLKGAESERLKLSFKAYNLGGEGKWVTLEDMTSVLACSSEVVYPTLLKFIRGKERTGGKTTGMDLERREAGMGKQGAGMDSLTLAKTFRALSRRNAAAYAQKIMVEFGREKDGRLNRKEFERWARSGPVLRCRLNEFSIDVNAVPFQGVRLA